mmetsp:Transcript_22794/g.86347  ORF Transcript_22794/g.86347 Transcript_22794/m.86347 type:complete len:458 (+) Transcript_22794:2477-3850(+)
MKVEELECAKWSSRSMSMSLSRFFSSWASVASSSIASSTVMRCVPPRRYDRTTRDSHMMSSSGSTRTRSSSWSTSASRARSSSGFSCGVHCFPRSGLGPSPVLLEADLPWAPPTAAWPGADGSRPAAAAARCKRRLRSRPSRPCTALAMPPSPRALAAVVSACLVASSLAFISLARRGVTGLSGAPHRASAPISRIGSSASGSKSASVMSSPRSARSCSIAGSSVSMSYVMRRRPMPASLSLASTALRSLRSCAAAATMSVCSFPPRDDATAECSSSFSSRSSAAARELSSSSIWRMTSSRASANLDSASAARSSASACRSSATSASSASSTCSRSKIIDSSTLSSSRSSSTRSVAVSKRCSVPCSTGVSMCGLGHACARSSSTRRSRHRRSTSAVSFTSGISWFVRDCTTRRSPAAAPTSPLAAITAPGTCPPAPPPALLAAAAELGPPDASVMAS